MIPATKIDLGEETSTLQLVKEFINHRNRKLVLDGAVVKSAKVDAEAPTAILLANEEHRGGEWRSRLPDDPLLQHIIALPLNFVLEELWVAVGPHSHRWGTRDEVNTVVMASTWRQSAWLLEDVRIG